MKKVFLAVCLITITICTYSQQLSQVSFSGGATLAYIAFSADQGVLIRCTDDGKIMEWGTEVRSLRSNYIAPRLQPFAGRVDYYGAEADSMSRGKIKNIGTCTFTYYGQYETAERRGKIKSIGSLILDYYSNYENATLKGKLKQVGSITLEYYGDFENEAYRGKLKSVGGNGITYYSSFDDKQIRGKVKSIGGVNYTWYTSLDPGRMNGLKTGTYRQNIGGITYILW